jgi:hypothetical protein
MSQVNETSSILELSNPIDTPKQVRTLSLCLNRILNEPGLVAKIQGYYKGIVMSDAWFRFSAIDDVLRDERTRADNPQTTALIVELNSLMQYYINSVGFILMSSYLLCHSSGFERTIRETVICSTTSIIVQATRSQSDALSIPFMFFVDKNLDGPCIVPENGLSPVQFPAWSAYFIGLLIRTGGLELIIDLAIEWDLGTQDDFDRKVLTMVQSTMAFLFLCVGSMVQYGDVYLPRLQDTLHHLHSRDADNNADVMENDDDNESENDNEEEGNDRGESEAIVRDGE